VIGGRHRIRHPEFPFLPSSRARTAGERSIRASLGLPLTTLSRGCALNPDPALGLSALARYGQPSAVLMSCAAVMSAFASATEIFFPFCAFTSLMNALSWLHAFAV